MKEVTSLSSTGGSTLGVDCVVCCVELVSGEVGLVSGEVGLVSGEVGAVVSGGNSGIDPILHCSSKQ